MTGREVISEVVVRALDGAKGQPEMRAAGRALGTSARIVAETVRSALLPFAAVNFGVRKFEAYIRGKFADELDEAVSSIPEGSLQEPPLNIAGPVMQGLSFTYESEELRRMFLALLATSMDASREDAAHPAFADIVRQLAPGEAPILAAILDAGAGIDVVRYSLRGSDALTRSTLREHILPLFTDPDRAQVPTDGQLTAWVDNWTRLGLVEVGYEYAFAGSERYQWVDGWPVTKSLRAVHGDNVIVDRGTLIVTAWGRAFARAVTPSADEESPYLFRMPEVPDADPDTAAPHPLDAGAP